MQETVKLVRDANARLRTRPPLVIAFAYVLAMLPIGLFITGLGLLVLKLAGGAAADTATVVMVLAFAATDLWGGWILEAATRLPADRIVPPWMAARVVVWLALLLLFGSLIWVLPVMFVLAVPAVYGGARASAAQARLARAESRAAVRRRHSPHSMRRTAA
jgi:hypothetical protein